MAQPEDKDRRIGTVIGGRFRLLSVMGTGGMGVVYRAEHLLLKRDVALKLLHAHLRDHPRRVELAQRFLREAQSLALLDPQNPHIVQIVDCGIEDDATLYMAMELCEGETLSEVLAAGPLPPGRALHVVVQVLRALVHAHGKGIVHRDLKPDNVMLTRRDGLSDFVKILDFGIAKLISETRIEPERDPKRSAESGRLARNDDAGPPPATYETPPDEAPPDEARPARPALGASLTRAGVIFGTPEYLAPEQARGLEVDARTDLYAVGVMLWELLVGRRPFVANSALAIISLHLLTPPDPPSQHVQGLPPSLDAVVLRAMAKRPEDRFASAEEFLRALDRVLEELDATPSRMMALTGLLRVTSQRKTSPTAPEVSSVPAGTTLAGKMLAGITRARTLWGQSSSRAAARFDPVRTRLLERLGIKGTAAVVGVVLLLGLLATAWLAVRFRPGRIAELAQRPLPPALLTELSRAEALLAAGRLYDAREILDRARATYPQSPRVLSLLGHLHAAAGDDAAALGEYREALGRDRTYRTDSTMLRNLGRMLDGPALGPTALGLLREQVGEPALPILRDCARTCKDPARRKAAAEAAAQAVPETESAQARAAPMPSGGEPQVALEALIERLENRRSCNERRSAALALEVRGDRRALGPLQAARRRAAGRRASNACMRSDLDRAITRLREKQDGQ